MRAVLFAWRRYTPPFLIGGAEVSQQLLAEQFASNGWEVTYLGSHEAPWNGASELDNMRRQLSAWDIDYVHDESRAVLRYLWKGIECQTVPQATLFAALNTFLKTDPPELVVTSQEGSAVLAARARSVATVAGWIHSVSHTGTEVLLARPQFALMVSRFVLSQSSTPSGTTAFVFYPPFAPSTPHVADEARPGDLLMVNPVPAKGGRLITQLAALLPHRTFTLVEGWWDTSKQFAGLDNVRYLSRTYNMNDVYRQHRLLLVPSMVEDAFPRVIIEAGLAGLPSIGSYRGGIAEAIEDGGIVVPNAEPAVWASAIQSLDASRRADRAVRAYRRSARLVRDCVAELAAAGVIAAI